MTAIARIYPPEPSADTSRDLVRELLVIGRERVAQPGGWLRDDLVERPGAVSVAGAVTDPDRQPWFNIVVQRLALKALLEQLPFYWCVGWESETEVLSYWNSAPWRTQKQAIKLFDRAIRGRDNG